MFSEQNYRRNRFTTEIKFNDERPEISIYKSETLQLKLYFTIVETLIIFL